MSDALKDLEEGEVSWLKKLADEEVHIVPTTVAERLRSLGLAIQVAPASADELPQFDHQDLGVRISAEGLELLKAVRYNRG